jgi:hypothetical protein
MLELFPKKLQISLWVLKYLCWLFRYTYTINRSISLEFYYILLYVFNRRLVEWHAYTVFWQVRSIINHHLFVLVSLSVCINFIYSFLSSLQQLILTQSCGKVPQRCRNNCCMPEGTEVSSIHSFQCILNWVASNYNFPFP